MTNSETLAMFKSSGALLDGHFRLTSGRHSNSYFQCAKVLQYPEYLSAICGQIAGFFRESGITTVPPLAASSSARRSVGSLASRLSSPNAKRVR